MTEDDQSQNSLPTPVSTEVLVPPEAPATRRWHTNGILHGLWIYLATLGGAGLALAFLPEGNTRTALLVLPLFTAVLLIVITWLVYRGCAEHLRRKIQRCIARTAVIMALGTLGYFCLELMGYPRQSMIVVNLLGWAVFSVQLLFVLGRARSAG